MQGSLFQACFHEGLPWVSGIFPVIHLEKQAKCKNYPEPCVVAHGPVRTLPSGSAMPLGSMRHFLGHMVQSKVRKIPFLFVHFVILPCFDLGTEFSELLLSAITFLSSTDRHYFASINPREVLIFRITRFINKKTYKTYIDVGFGREQGYDDSNEKKYKNIP